MRKQVLERTWAIAEVLDDSVQVVPVSHDLVAERIEGVFVQSAVPGDRGRLEGVDSTLGTQVMLVEITGIGFVIETLVVVHHLPPWIVHDEWLTSRCVTVQRRASCPNWTISEGLGLTEQIRGQGRV